LLKHCVENGSRPPNNEPPIDALQQLDPVALRTTGPGYNYEIQDTPVSFVADIIRDYVLDTGAAIPIAELKDRIVEEAINEQQKESALSVVNGIKDVQSNGSDIPYIVERLNKQAVGIRCQAKLGRIAKEGLWKSDPDTTIDELSRLVDDVESRKVNEGTIDITDDNAILQRLERFRAAQDGQVDEGMKTGWDKLDHHTRGLHGGQTVIVAAGAKTGKSSFCIATCAQMAFNAAIAGEQYDIVIANKEMHNAWQQTRYEAWLVNQLLGRERPDPNQTAGLCQRIDYGNLTAEETEAYANAMEMLGNSMGKVHMLAPNAYNNLSELSAKIKAIEQSGRNVGVVYVDALSQQKTKYAPSDATAAKGEALRFLERGIAFEHDCMVLIEAQERREMVDKRNVRVGDIVYNAPSAASHSVSYMMRLFDVPGDEHLLEVQMVAARHCAPGWSFPLKVWHGDMLLEEGDDRDLKRIDSLMERM